MDLNTLLLDGFAVLALTALAVFLLAGIALSVADLAGRDLGDRPEPGDRPGGWARRPRTDGPLAAGVAR